MPPLAWLPSDGLLQISLKGLIEAAPNISQGSITMPASLFVCFAGLLPSLGLISACFALFRPKSNLNIMVVSFKNGVFLKLTPKQLQHKMRVFNLRGGGVSADIFRKF